MNVDLLLDPFGADWRDVCDTARAAADAGFDGIWMWDHLDGRVHGAAHILECWTTLTAIATSVPQEIMIGPLVLNVANRRPGVLATMAATLQHVSGGRLLLGLGAGGGAATPYAREQYATGGPVPSDAVRREQVVECIETVRRLWKTPGFLQPTPPPPFVVGAFGPKMAEVAGRIGDGINTQAWHPQLDRMLDVARAAHADAGRDPEDLLTTVFAGYDARWLRADSPPYARLVDHGVHRLILLVHAPYDRAAISAAGELLRDERKGSA